LVKNIISCRPGSYRKYAHLAFEYLPKAGIYNVEISPPAPDEIPRTKAELRRHGLTAASLATGCNLAKESDIRALEQSLETARKMDVGVVFCSTNSGGLPGRQPFEKLAILGDAAASCHTVISMETHPDLCQNGDQMLRTMKLVNHPNVRINFDTANIYYYNEGVDAVAELKKIARYVASVHLKDTNGKPKTWYFPTLGKGVVDYPSVFRILNELGFRGPFTLEMEGIEGEDLTLEQTHQRIVDSVNYLREIGVI